MQMGLIDRLFLVKTITSREGKVHFRRWRLLATPWFSVYVHHIARSDEDEHLHSHPWNFRSLILKGGYSEEVSWWDSPFDNQPSHRVDAYSTGQSVYHSFREYHKITLKDGKPAWTLVLTSNPRRGDWGYLVDGKFVDHVTYRQRKHPND